MNIVVYVNSLRPTSCCRCCCVVFLLVLLIRCSYCCFYCCRTWWKLFSAPRCYGCNRFVLRLFFSPRVQWRQDDLICAIINSTYYPDSTRSARKERWPRAAWVMCAAVCTYMPSFVSLRPPKRSKTKHALGLLPFMVSRSWALSTRLELQSRFWGQTSQILSKLSPKLDCGS